MGRAQIEKRVWEKDYDPAVDQRGWVTEGPIDREEVMECAERIDWKQAHIHGGDPCFVVIHSDEPDDAGVLQHIHRFCLRAKRWHTGPEFHDFVGLHDMLLSLEPPEEPQESETEAWNEFRERHGKDAVENL